MYRLDAFAFSCVGAIAVQILHWLTISRQGHWPKYSKSFIHWLLTAGLVLLSGIIGLAFFYNRQFDPLLGLQTGASAPLFIEKAGAAILPEAKHHLGEEGL